MKLQPNLFTFFSEISLKVHFSPILLYVRFFPLKIGTLLLPHMTFYDVVVASCIHCSVQWW